MKNFKSCPLLGILRDVPLRAIPPLVDTSIGAGLKAVEVTMNTESAADLIRDAVKTSGGRIAVGAGTVLDMDTLRCALDAGASFIVMPTLVDEVVRYCVSHKIPVFPGALTPQEIYNAWQAGATMVKVFPARSFGPDYFSEIKGPFRDIELLACGGVTAENIGAYMASGASAAAFGGSVFKKEWIASGDYRSMGALIKSYIAAMPVSLGG